MVVEEFRSRAGRVAKNGCVAAPGIPACEINHPGAAAQPRPPASAGFREADATSGFGLSPNALDINGANTYQFVMGNPVDAVDASGLCGNCVAKALQQLANANRAAFQNYLAGLAQFANANEQMAFARLGQSLARLGLTNLIAAGAAAAAETAAQSLPANSQAGSGQEFGLLARQLQINNAAFKAALSKCQCNCKGGTV
jgi:hypothetical protein